MQTDRILDWHINDSAGWTQHQVIAAMDPIPSYIFSTDPRPAFEQIDERHPWGWNPHTPGKWVMDEKNYLFYPGDPPLVPLAVGILRDEAIFIYNHNFVCIVQANGDFSVAKVD